MNETVVLLLTGLVGLVFSFLVVTVFNISGTSDDALGRDLQQLVMQMISLLVSTVCLPLNGTWSITTDVATMMISRAKWIIAFVLFTACTLLMHYYHHEILSILDDGWTCFLVPFMKHFITPLLQIVRIFFAITTPILNAFLVVHGQIIKAWYVMVLKCSSVNLIHVFREVSRIFITGTVSIANWFGYGSAISSQNNFYVNDFIIHDPVNHTLTALSVGEKALTCACKQFQPIFNILFFATQEEHVTKAIDAAFQTGVRVFQLFFKTLFMEFPDIYRVSHKLERALVEGGLAADSIMFNVLRNLIKLFDREFKMTKHPQEAVFTMAGRTAAAGVHAAATLGVHGPLHILATFDPEITPFDTEVWSIEYSLSQIHAAVYSGAVFLQWVLYVVERLVTDTVKIGDVFSSDSTPLKLDCDWARDVAEHKFVPISYTAGCASYYLGITSANTAYITWGTIVELLLKSLFTQEQNVFRTLQRWEGPSLPRNKVFSCETRRDMSAYDFTNGKKALDTHDDNYVSHQAFYNKDGWLWSQDAGKCQCERFYGTSHDEDETFYNPWCGQPNLNFDVFAPLEAVVMHVSHGFLGPGFGDAFPYINPIRSVNIDADIGSLGSVKKDIKLPFPLPPITRTAIESVRILTRVALSFGDIITGHFFNYPVNCGHGLNMEQLRVKWEIETGDLSVGLTDEVLRWTHCEWKSYSALTDEKRTPVCDTTNDSRDCMCSYMQPLTVKSQCKCISRYPDLDVTAASQEVGDLIEKRFTSTEVVAHWCNSMLLEWTFQNTGEFADALDYMVSLGPINPTCDVVDRLISDADSSGGYKANVLDKGSSSSSFLIAQTPTLYGAIKEFMDADTKLNHIRDIFSDSSKSGCQIKPGAWLNATDNEGNIVYEADGVTAVQVLVESEWSCDASEGLVSLASVDLDTMEEDEKDDERGCRIWGRKDFFCSAGLYVRNTKRLSMNVARQFVNDAIALLSGNYADINIRTLPRLCDYERQQGAIASMIAAVLPRANAEMRIAFTKFINVGLQYINVQLLRTVLIITNVATTMIMDFVSGTFSSDKVETTFITALEALVRSYLELLKQTVDAIGDLLNAVKPGAGDICETAKDIIVAVQDAIVEGLLDFAALVIKTAMQFLAVVTGDSSLIDELFVNIFKLWSEIQMLLIKQMWTILGKIYDFFGPVGDFMKILTYGVCMAINGVMATIDGIAKVVTFGWGIGWEPMKCVSPGSLSSSHHNHTTGRLGRHFLQAGDNTHLPRRVAEALDWNGTSVCDHFMSAAAEYSYTDLRPLERATWMDCLELKLIGVELQNFFESRSFPTDVAYNWKRKYIMMYDAVRALKILGKEYMDHKKIHWGTVRLNLYDAGLDADLYMSIFTKMQDGLYFVLHTLETTSVLENVFSHIDPEYANKENPSKTALAWRTFSAAKQVTRKATSEWQNRDASKQLWKATDAMYDSHVHIRSWWSSLGKTNTGRETPTERLFQHIRQRTTKQYSEPEQTSKLQRKSPMRWLHTPLRTELKTCSARGNPAWCTDCSILDNAIATVIEQAEGMGAFYTGRFPGIIGDVDRYFDSFNDVDQKLFEKRYTNLASAAPSVPKTSVRWTYHVTEDWSNLADNFSAYWMDTTYDPSDWDGQVEHFLNGTKDFFTVVDDTYVPYFGYSLAHIIDFVLGSKCDLDQTIFVTESSTEERLVRMDRALIACLILAIVIATNTTWSVFPLVWLANTVVMGALIGFLYLFMVYGYYLGCAPLVPYTLVEDINAWYETRLAPGCFYKPWSHMAIDPNDDLCLVCSAPDEETSEYIKANLAFEILAENDQFNGTFYNITLGPPKRYLNCATYTAAGFTEGMLPLHELMSEYHIFWNLMFWLRWKWPDLGLFAVRNGLVSLDSIVGQLALQTWQQAPVDPVWIDCFKATQLNVPLSLIIIGAGSYVVFRVTMVLFQAAVQSFLLLWYTYTALGYLTLTVEKSIEKQ